MEHFLTAAALRVIEAARGLTDATVMAPVTPEVFSPHDSATRLNSAARLNSDQVVEAAMFWALLEEESVAHQRLIEQGLEIDDLRQRMKRFLPSLPFAVSDESDRSSSLSTAFDRMIRQARHEAHKVSRSEVGTEHLLRALFETNGWLTAWLAQERIALAKPVEEISGPTTSASGAPLEHEQILLPETAPPENLTAVYRLLDASGNRAREGLRVIEDAVRMVRNDGWFSRELKELRHRLTTALRMLPEEALLASRDTPNDVGTQITTMSETMRGSANDVIAAAFKRLQESLRSLEEYGKIINGYFASRIEAIRYQSYTLEKAVRIGQFSQTTLEGRVLYLLLTEKLCHRPVGQTLREALRAGVGIVQIREKSMSDRRLLDHTRLVLDLAHEYDALVIMNDRPDLAALTQADGIHVGQDELTIAQVRQIAGPRPLVGVSTHSLQQAEAAVIEGASYIGVGPTFPTTTKEFVEYAGLEYVREVAREIDLPAYAIGGITTENAAEVVAAGATRLAVSSAICSAKEPYDAANQLLELLNGG